MRKLLKKVLRFDDTTYKLGGRRLPAKLPTDLAGLQDCTERLIYEIDIESVATGLDVHVEVSFPLEVPWWKREGSTVQSTGFLLFCTAQIVPRGHMTARAVLVDMAMHG